MDERHLIVGTAGHIDHGKSALVRALTGVDPDRLKEEKERGITIDLGFADMTLGPGRVVSFVDVPGHERFVRHMIAGASGIDAVLLVVAADEGVCPQTREHVQIASLLGLEAGVVALTRCDAADAEVRGVVALELREFLQGTFLEGAPLVEVSAKTGQGLDRLREALEDLFERLPARPEAGLPRLAVDRAFVLRGFGTVVTGTLASGRLEVGQEVEVLPGGRRARIRGLQVHRRAVELARAGQRVAVNLQGLERDAVPRGSTLAAPGTLATTRRIAAEVCWLAHAPEKLRRGGRVRFHHGTSECNARLRRLRGGADGDPDLVVLSLEAPAVLVPGDRFILRLPAPLNTVGGGLVRDTRPPRRVRAEDYAAAEADEERLARHLRRAGRAGAALDTLARALAVPRATAEGWLERLEQAGRAVRCGAHAFERGAWRTLWEEAEAFLRQVHEEDPLAAGYPREALRSRLCPAMPQEVWRQALEQRAAAGRLALVGDRVALATHRVVLSAEDEALVERLEARLREAGLDPPAVRDWLAGAPDPQRARRLVEWLAEQGKIVRLGDGRWVHAEALEALRRKLAAFARRRRRMDVATFKELAGVSRRSAIPLLEYLDAVRVTRRIGNEREILLPAAEVSQGAGVPQE